MNKIVIREVRKVEVPRSRIWLNKDFVERLVNSDGEVVVTYYDNKIVITRKGK